ncbi:MAG: LysR family transcriptional regulator [Legionellales bacterium]|nr:LysR family transcriptional regulator [Legionellales bacterium]
MRITLHQLQVFKRVAELQSVSLAAQSLHMTQPAVSNILRQVEQYYQCTLVQVMNRKLHLTEFGKVVLQMAQDLDGVLTAGVQKIQSIKGLITGNLTVAIATTAKYFMPHLLGEYKQKYPGTHIQMKVYHRELILERLEKNLDDFVVLSQLPDFIEVDAYPIFADELVVAASVHHPLAKKNSPLALNELHNENWIIREAGSGTRIAMLALFNRQKFLPVIDMELGNNEAIKQALMADLGISVVSHHSIKHEVANQLLTVLNVADFPLPHVWYYVTLKNKRVSPAAEAFLELFKIAEHPHRK